MKRSTVLLLSAVLALTFSSTLWAQADGFSDQPWHFTYQIGGANWDNDRLSTDGDVWNSIGFGRFFGDNLSVDVEWDEFSGDIDPVVVDDFISGATYNNWRVQTWSLMTRYYFTDNNWRPYVVGGLGRTKHSNIFSNDDNFSYSYGVGLQTKFAKHWSGRAQIIRRKDKDSSTFSNNGSYHDYYFSIGLNFDFGGTEPPPPPPPPPPPAPEKKENPDLDGDGVLNERDKCPNSRPGAVVDLDGCEVEAVIELKGVHFDFDQDTLRPDAIAILNDAAALLNEHERVVVEVAGHTDSRGSDEYNQGLSERRANRVRDYLASKGVTASRLSARGYGESRPVSSNDTDEGRADNRRVELVILDR